MYIALDNLWFLWAVFWCSMAVVIANRLFGDSGAVYMAGLLLTFVVPDILNLHLYKFMYPYFMIGYFFNRRSLAQRYKAVYSSDAFLWASGIAYALLLVPYRRSTYIYISGDSILRENMLGQLGTDIYRFVIGLAGSVFVMLLVRRAYERFSGLRKSCALLTLGRNTKGVYIISQLVFFYILPKLTGSFAPRHYSIVAVETAVILAASLTAVLLLRKQRWLSLCLFGE